MSWEDRKVKISKEAEALFYAVLKKENMGLPQFMAASPVLVANFLELDVQEIPGKTLEPANGNDAVVIGSLDRTNAQRVICIARDYPPEQKRFTIWHEIGHAVLHPGTKFHRDRYVHDKTRMRSREPMEKEADFFAGCGLAPSKLLRTEFCARFSRGVVDGRRRDDKLVHQLNLGLPEGSKILPIPFNARMTTTERAEVVARYEIGSQRSLSAVFGMSSWAMAHQLVDGRYVL